MTSKLSGRVALITGGGGGIGAATARLLAAHGASVVVADINEDAAMRVAKEIADGGGAALGVAVDMAEESQVTDAVDATVSAYGRLDVLHNNAAPLQLVRIDHALLDMELSTWDATMATTLRGPMLFTRTALPHLIESGVGSIVFTSSLQALVGDRSMPAYSAAKAALLSLTRSVATQYGHVGVRCNAVCPGHIGSERVVGEARERLVRQQLLRRLGAPDDIANAVLFFASDDSSFVTGQVLSVDGGTLVHSPTYADGGFET